MLPQTLQQWQDFLSLFEKEHKNSPTFDKDYLELTKFAAHSLLQNNKLKDARQLYNRALQLANQQQDRDSLAEILNSLAQIYYMEADLDDAYNFALQSLNIYRELYGENSRQVADAYNNLAIIAERRGDTEKAIELITKNIEIAQQLPDIDSAYLISSYNNLAGIYWSAGQMRQALYYLEKARSLSEQTGEDNDLQLAEIYNNLALINMEIGHLDLAMKFQKKALDIYDRTEQDASFDRAISYKNLAVICKKQNQIVEAIQALDKSIQLLRAIFPYGNPEIEKALEIKEQWMAQL